MNLLNKLTSCGIQNASNKELDKGTRPSSQSNLLLLLHSRVSEVLVILEARKLTCLADLLNLESLSTLPLLVFKSTCGAAKTVSQLLHLLVLGLLIDDSLLVLVNQLWMSRRISGKHLLWVGNLVLDVVHLANCRQILLQFTQNTHKLIYLLRWLGLLNRLLNSSVLHSLLQIATLLQVTRLLLRLLLDVVELRLLHMRIVKPTHFLLPNVAHLLLVLRLGMLLNCSTLLLHWSPSLTYLWLWLLELLLILSHLRYQLIYQILLSLLTLQHIVLLIVRFNTPNQPSLVLLHL